MVQSSATKELLHSVRRSLLESDEGLCFQLITEKIQQRFSVNRKHWGSEGLLEQLHSSVITSERMAESAAF